jgi:hypothetical protein
MSQNELKDFELKDFGGRIKQHLETKYAEISTADARANQSAMNAINKIYNYTISHQDDKHSMYYQIPPAIKDAERTATKAREARDSFVEELSDALRGIDSINNPSGGGGVSKKHSRRHRKKRGKKMRATRSKH